MPEPNTLRKQHFEANCLAWVALNHFLPADLLRELSHVLVEAVGGAQFQLGQLFEERVITAVDGLEAWAVRPLEIKSPLAQYLQNRVRYLIWANDTDLFYNQNQQEAAAGRITPGEVEDAIRLGQCDLRGFELVARRLKIPAQTSIESLLLAIRMTDELRRALDTSELTVKIVDTCDTIPMPLAAVVMKHLGDLCVDADEWDAALRFYQTTAQRLDRENVDDWSGYLELLKAITTQSVAAALRAAQGPDRAAIYLAPRVQAATLSKSLFFLLNASLDSYAAEDLASEALRFPPDRRTSMLNEPLLLQSRDLTSAFEASSEGEYQIAFGYFWSVLRRQIALGSASDTRVTQAHYARSVFSSLEHTIDGDVDRNWLITGVRLLVQSGQTPPAKKLIWSERLVRAYIDDDVVTVLLSQIDAVPASREERLGVAVELMRGWCLALPAERKGLAARMLSFVSKVAVGHKSAFSGRHNVGGRSMEVLREVARRRPEFRRGVAADVVPAILSKFEPGEWWTGTAEAFNVAGEFLDVLGSQDVRKILDAVLALLEKADPARAAWVVVQPAIDLLATPVAQQLAKVDTDFDNRIVATILRFGLNQETEHTRLLFYLYQFDLKSVYQEPTLSQLREVVQKVRKHALTINASNSMDNIRALLLAPAAAGPEGIKDALKAISDALNTAFGDKRWLALSFPIAYEAFIVLAQTQEQIAKGISQSTGEFQRLLYPIIDQIVAVWGEAAKNPGIFAPMGFRRRATPSPVIVHNWAFGSIALARSIGEQGKVAAALDAAASKEPTLAGPIATARAARLALGELENLDPDSIRSDNAEAFYSALGQRLVAVQHAPSELREGVIDSLLEQCLRLGPNGLDAAVFVAAGDSKLQNLRSTDEFADYFKRVEHNRELRLTLIPFLAKPHQ
jgi:hypothetical protein